MAATWLGVVRDLGGTAGLLAAPIAYVLGGRRTANATATKLTAEGGKASAEGDKANAEAAAAVVEAAVKTVEVSETVVARLEAEVTRLAERVERAEDRTAEALERAADARREAQAAERRSHAAELHASLLLQSLIEQRAAYDRLDEWAGRASAEVARMGGTLDAPPRTPELAVPTAVSVQPIPEEG